MSMIQPNRPENVRLLSLRAGPLAKRKMRPRELPGCSFHYLLIAKPDNLSPVQEKYSGKRKAKEARGEFAKVEILPSADPNFGI